MCVHGRCIILHMCDHVRMSTNAPAIFTMPQVSLEEAARLTGKDKSTISRAAKSGRLSYTQDENGQRVFAPSELDRVFGIAVKRPDNDSTSDASAHVRTRAMHQDAHAHASPNVHTEVREMRDRERALMEDTIRRLEDQIDDLKGDRDHWRQQATMLLTYQRPAEESVIASHAEVEETRPASELAEATVPFAAQGAGDQMGAPQSLEEEVRSTSLTEEQAFTTETASSPVSATQADATDTASSSEEVATAPEALRSNSAMFPMKRVEQSLPAPRAQRSFIWRKIFGDPKD